MKTRRLSIVALAIVSLTFTVRAQTTAFRYQGSLTDGGSAANGSFQMQFKLFDAVSAGNQIGSTLNDIPVTATNGVFSVSLDFGTSALNGANRWIEIAVRRNSGESYVTLSPRERISSAPYAVRTLSAATADTALDSQKLGGVNANQFVQTNDARLSDARNPLPGSSSYIQNSAAQQASSNFNISGSGTAAALNVNGPFSFGNIAAPPAAPAGQGRFYFDTATNKLRVSENGGAYVNLVGATGVSGSGTANRIPFWSAGTTLGDSNIFQSGTNIGIGTATPGAGLEIRGTGFAAGQRLTDNTSGNSLVLQSGAGGNMKVTGWNYNTATAVPLFLSVDGANTLINSNGGFVGIGTASPFSKLSVNSNLFGISHTDGTVNLSTYINASAGWFGTVSNHPLHFYANNSQPLVTLTQSGGFGVGTTTPLAGYKLDIAGPTRVFGDAAHFVAHATGGTNSWARFYMRSTSQSWFIGTSQNFNGNQLYIGNETSGQTPFVIATNGNVGVGTTNPAAKLYVDGAVGQSLSGSGFPKALIFVQANGTMTSCYNGVTGTGIIVGCGGITVTHPFPQTYNINFGFSVAGRVMALTSYTTEQGSISPIVGRIAQGANANSISVLFWRTDNLSPTPSDFFLIVY